MKSSRRTLAALLVVALAVSCPLVAHAQFGGLGDRLKKKATQAITGKPATPATRAANADQAEAPDTNVVEITADVLARFETGLHAEEARRQEVEAKLKAVRKPEDYSTCEGRFDMSEQGRKLASAIRTAGGQNADAVSAAIANRQAALDVFCGHDPSDYEYKRTLQASIPTAGSGPANLSQRQYAILRERVQAFLSKNRGMYVFTPAEDEALKTESATLKNLMKDQL